MVESLLMVGLAKAGKVGIEKLVRYYEANPEVAKKHAKRTRAVLKWAALQVADSVFQAEFGQRIQDLLNSLFGNGAPDALGS